MIKNEMTLKMLSEDFVSLNRNGSDLFCPYVPPLPMRQQQGQLAGSPVQVNFTRSSCTSLCPLFDILEGGKRVRVNCGIGCEYQISKIIPLETQNNQQNNQQNTDNIVKLNK